VRIEQAQRWSQAREAYAGVAQNNRSGFSGGELFTPLA